MGEPLSQGNPNLKIFYTREHKFMATILRAWQAFGTRLQLNQTAQLSEVAEWMCLAAPG